MRTASVMTLLVALAAGACDCGEEPRGGRARGTGRADTGGVIGDADSAGPGDALDTGASADDAGGSDAGALDAGADPEDAGAGGPRDAGASDATAADATSGDAGARDTGTALDSGVTPDAGVATDSGVAIDAGFAPDASVPDAGGPLHVHIEVSNTCVMSVSPPEVTIAHGERPLFSWHNHSADYPVDVWLSYGGGYLDLATGATWDEPIMHCIGPNAHDEYADLSAGGCAEYRFFIRCL